MEDETRQHVEHPENHGDSRQEGRLEPETDAGSRLDETDGTDCADADRPLNDVDPIEEYEPENASGEDDPGRECVREHRRRHRQ